MCFGYQSFIRCVFPKYVPLVYGSPHSLHTVISEQKLILMRSSLSIISFLDPVCGVEPEVVGCSPVSPSQVRLPCGLRASTV